MVLDIVLEFVSGALNEEQTREANRCLIRHFQDARPADGGGVRGGRGWHPVMTFAGKE